MQKMTKEQRNKMLRRWRMRKVIVYTIAAILIIVGAILAVKGVFSDPLEHTWMLVTGWGLIIAGGLLFPDMWKETFKDYLKKKGL